ncbi:MAG: hypothetical protein F6J93_17745 [Oscillatoria sp. SIO1A7]|nr:hypothetical protein [Oscillatoria sp. SIO1A7]
MPAAPCQVRSKTYPIHWEGFALNPTPASPHLGQDGLTKFKGDRWHQKCLSLSD